MMSYWDTNALKLCHHYWEEHLKEGMTVVDATAGRGRDTELLARMVGEDGRVHAFDIQKEAIESTRERLQAAGLLSRAALYHESHRHMAKRLQKADAVVFNLGYLPGGDHSVGTRAEESIPALEAALSLIGTEGFVTVCLYYGGASGMEEYHSLLAFLRSLDPKRYTVMVQEFYNRPNCPPIFIVIEPNR